MYCNILEMNQLKKPKKNGSHKINAMMFNLRNCLNWKPCLSHQTRLKKTQTDKFILEKKLCPQGSVFFDDKKYINANMYQFVYLTFINFFVF